MRVILIGTTEQPLTTTTRLTAHQRLRPDGVLYDLAIHDGSCLPQCDAAPPDAWQVQPVPAETLDR